MSGTEDVGEELVEIVEEATSHAGRHRAALPWDGHAALTTLVVGVLAALAATLGGIAANEATLRRVHESIDIVEQRGDQTELALLETRHDVLRALGEPVPDDEAARAATLRDDIDALDTVARSDEAAVQRSLQAHEILLGAVTLFSVAITLTGMAVITSRRRLWHVGIALSAGGGALFVWGLATYL